MHPTFASIGRSCTAKYTPLRHQHISKGPQHQLRRTSVCHGNSPRGTSIRRSGFWKDGRLLHIDGRIMFRLLAFCKAAPAHMLVDESEVGLQAERSSAPGKGQQLDPIHCLSGSRLGDAWTRFRMRRLRRVPAWPLVAPASLPNSREAPPAPLEAAHPRKCDRPSTSHHSQRKAPRPEEWDGLR